MAKPSWHPRDVNTFELSVAVKDENDKPQFMSPDQGLTSEEAETLLEKWGPNDIPVHEKSMLAIFASQFYGTMPFILEVCIIISAAVQDWVDFAIILAMLMINACLGMREELKAKAELKKLTSKMVSSISVSRDGIDCMLPVTELVPGDRIFLVGGCLVPADVEWLSGDVLSIDTSALTGEALPRKYPCNEYGKHILGGATVKAGEAYARVLSTGVRTEIGQGQAEIAKDRTVTSVSVFERKTLRVVSIIIGIAVFDAIVIILVQGLARDEFSGSYKNPLLAGLVILIASVPIALPLVLQVTMAMGAGSMASDHHAIVTRMSALQDIAAMQVLCSDKTGTITTAHMTINLDKCACQWSSIEALKAKGARFPDSGSMQNENSLHDIVLFVAALGSNPAKVEDAVDSAVLRAFREADKKVDGELHRVADSYEKLELTGFDPIYKRTVATLRQREGGLKIIVAKGILGKILDTRDGGEDDAPHQWKCVNTESLGGIKGTDEKLAKDGYKTIAIAVAVDNGVEDLEFHFLGILPMMDPPRHDSLRTIHRLLEVGIEVKMVTGDHLNIATETARLVGLSTNILLGEETRQGTYERDDLVRHAGGFAQVLPRDKREVVQVLQRSFGLVVGMTGDGVNDAPALSCAQCGIAVADATDAAKNAAAMILTEQGLGAVFGAVVESRKISARLSAYVIYRLAATIQILVALTVIVLAFNCEVNTIYVVLLALLNDVTMIPIAHDRQHASKSPTIPSVHDLVYFSVTLGLVQAAFTLIFYGFMDTWLSGDLSRDNQAAFGQTLYSTKGFYCNDYAQLALWLQISLSAELLIYVTRAPGVFFLSRPSNGILASTLIGGALLSTLLAKYVFSPGTDGLLWSDIGKIWAFNLVCLVILDAVKLAYKHFFEHGVAGVVDEDRYAQEDEEICIAAEGGGPAEGVMAVVVAPGTPKPPGTPSRSIMTGPRGLPSMRAVRMHSASAPDSTASRVSAFLREGRSLTSQTSIDPGTPTPAHYSQAAGRTLYSHDRRTFERSASSPIPQMRLERSASSPIPQMRQFTFSRTESLPEQHEVRF